MLENSDTDRRRVSKKKRVILKVIKDFEFAMLWFCFFLMSEQSVSVIDTLFSVSLSPDVDHEERALY